MAFIPFQKLTVTSPLSPEEVLSRLAGALEPMMKTGRRWIFDPNAKPYEGEILGREFRIRRVIGYRNSFLPVITGTVEPAEQGSVISIKLRLRRVTAVFACLWIGLAAFFGAAAFLTLFLPDAPFNRLSLPALLFAPAGYTLVTAFFRMESGKSSAYFRELFEAEAG
jgi:hypothetical protein